MRTHQTFLILMLLWISNCLIGQPMQEIKGWVYDKDSKVPLIGASLVLTGSDTFGITSDLEGRFLFPAIPVGRYTLRCDYLGYSSYVTNEIILTSAKSLNLEIALLEAELELAAVTVKAKKFGNEPLNELSVVSTRSFGVEETQRFAASANDPSRMVLGFPGVQPSRDNRSDIVIRGNSSIGLLWRLEGIDIPNPNHFARKGSTGGGITVFSLSMLNNSDFSTGAFPAEYGNAFSGVFDMKFRTGNKDKTEHTFKAGMLGLEFSTEGPIQKGRSSYLLNYRYSTLGILSAFDIRLVDERTSNTFQDLSFKLDFQSKDYKHRISTWGIGGLSEEFFEAMEGTDNWRSYTDYLTRDFDTDMGAIGLTHTWQVDNNSYLKTSLALMGQQVSFRNDTLNQDRIATVINDESYRNDRLSFATLYFRKLSSKTALKTGMFVSRLFYDLERLFLIDNQYNTFLDQKGQSTLIQPFASLRTSLTPRTSLVLGIHAVYFDLNQSYSIEPRLGLRYQLNAEQSLRLGYGLHGRILPIGSYFYRDGSDLPNLDLGLIKAHHFVLGYDYVTEKGIKFTAEAYFQHLFDVPVSTDLGSTFSLLNKLEGFARRPLTSEGTGRNYGLDVSLEKAFRSGTFFVLAASIYDSQYSPLNGQSYSTTYNGNFTISTVAGKEWSFSQNRVLQLGFRLMYNGGQRLTPILSNDRDPLEPLDPILDESRPFTEQVPNFFRPDIRIAYRKNNPSNAWILSLDIQNVIARRNISAINRDFDPDLGQWVFSEQSSLVPVLTYQIDF